MQPQFLCYVKLPLTPWCHHQALHLQLAEHWHVLSHQACCGHDGCRDCDHVTCWSRSLLEQQTPSPARISESESYVGFRSFSFPSGFTHVNISQCRDHSMIMTGMLLLCYRSPNAALAMLCACKQILLCACTPARHKVAQPGHCTVSTRTIGIWTAKCTNVLFCTHLLMCNISLCCGIHMGRDC